MGIVPLLKDRMRGGGMQPLRIISLIYCEMSSRQKSKKEASLGEVPLSVAAALLITRVKVVVISLYTQVLHYLNGIHEQQ